MRMQNDNDCIYPKLTLSLTRFPRTKSKSISTISTFVAHFLWRHSVMIEWSIQRLLKAVNKGNEMKWIPEMDEWQKRTKIATNRILLKWTWTWTTYHASKWLFERGSEMEIAIKEKKIKQNKKARRRKCFCFAEVKLKITWKTLKTLWITFDTRLILFRLRAYCKCGLWLVT